jgi:phosphoribosylformimino-5-aminoimidazole carboxamide ribonucleotide (ProFAR) isomerase
LGLEITIINHLKKDDIKVPSYIKTINENKNEVLEIKAAGGIKTYEEVMDYIDNGVTRIGMSNVSDLVNSHCDCEECNCGDDCNCEHECHCEDCEEEK